MLTYALLHFGVLGNFLLNCVSFVQVLDSCWFSVSICLFVLFVVLRREGGRGLFLSLFS